MAYYGYAHHARGTMCVHSSYNAHNIARNMKFSDRQTDSHCGRVNTVCQHSAFIQALFFNTDHTRPPASTVYLKGD